LSLVKYRIHEVAKDFGKQTKDISDIMTKYFTAPKNHMQILEDHELAVIFDYLTQKYPVESIESIFADVYHEPKPAAPAKPAAAPAQAPKQQAAPKQGQPAAQEERQGQRQKKTDRHPGTQQNSGDGEYPFDSLVHRKRPFVENKYPRRACIL